MELPQQIFAQHIAVLGKTGSGKSFALRYCVEHLLDEQQPVCIIDPKGDWWGLKSSASGKSAGYPVVIFGGEHADVPLNEHSGKHVAELIATGNRPCIIDLGGWMVGERTRFFVDFASTLFRTTRGKRYIVIDEVHNFAPQQKIEKNPDAMKMKHWANRLASEGRGKGLTILSASQRPQKVDKDFLTCAETLVAMRVIHKLDRDAIKDWIDGAGDAANGKEVLETLASMDRGTAWVWSPEAKYGPKRFAFPMFKTYDSFAADANTGAGKLKGWASVDLDEVSAKLATVVDEAKANDPAELKKQIAELKRQVAAKPAAAPDATATQRLVDKAVADRDRFWKGELSKAERAHGSVVGKLTKIHQLSTLNGDATIEIASPPEKSLPVTPTVFERPAGKALVQKVKEIPADRSADHPGEISTRQQRFLDAAATLSTLGVEVSRESVAGWVGVHPRGGSVGEELKALVDAGMIEMDRGRITVTEAGHSAAGYVDPSEAIARAKASLTPRQANFFELIVHVHPESISRVRIAEHFNLHPRGGSLGEDLGRLVGRGLVEGSRGEYRARDFLFAGSK